MIGRLTCLEPEPRRNVKLEWSVDQVASEISSPPGPIACSDVTGFEIKTWRFGRLILVCSILGSVGLCGVILYASLTADEVPNAAAIAVLIAMPLAGIWFRKKVLYSIFLLTSKPGKKRVRFYRTFSQLDLALLLDVMTFWVGDRPRKLT